MLTIAQITRSTFCSFFNIFNHIFLTFTIFNETYNIDNGVKKNNINNNNNKSSDQTH